MPEGDQHQNQHWPALDGLRALAIAGVVAYHLGYLASGWLGVDVFFVLSGYLITTLLLSERSRTGQISLRRFWARRARRLLPAVLTLLGAVGLYAWAGGPGVVGAQLRAPGLATLFYGANWQQLVASQNYFHAFSAPNPLVHMWSLAIEEQYYLVWPLMVVGISALALRSRKASKLPQTNQLVSTALMVFATALLVASATWMAVSSHLDSINRAYLGTDTRAWELLLGGVGAMVARPIVSHVHQRRWSWVIMVGSAAVATAVVLAGAGSTTAHPPGWLFDGGLVGVDACVLLVLIGSIRAPRGVLARILSLSALQWLGRISYSLYLWHLPLIDILTPETTGLRGPLLVVVRLSAMALASAASYYLIEQPLRHANWQTWRRRVFVPVGVGSAAALLVVGTTTPVLAGTGALASQPATSRTGPGAASSLITPGGFDLPSLQRPSATSPLRVWILGDSVMNDSSPGVTAALQATGDATVVANSSFGGWGLTQVPDWAHQLEQILVQYHPQLVIGTWSWDDQMAQGQPRRYEALLRAFLAALLRPKDGVEAVILLQFPQTGPSPAVQDPTQRHAAWVQTTRSQLDWDAEAKAAVLAFPGRAAYLSTASLFAPNGRFVAWMRTATGRWLRARKIDNAHMCPYGAAAFGQWIVGALAGPLRLGPTKAGWQSGTWVQDPRYNDPPGACPADQPPPHYRGIEIPVSVSLARGSAHGPR